MCKQSSDEKVATPVMFKVTVLFQNLVLSNSI